MKDDGGEMNKTMRKTIFSLFFLTATFWISREVVAAFDPSQTFDKKCSSCHTVGGGLLKGPDLKDVTKRRPHDWLIKFVQSPMDVINSGDPYAVKIYNEANQSEMPDQRLTADEITEILKFVESGGVGAATAKIKSALESKSEDAAKGLALFLGSRAFKNGGPACVSCHSVGDYGTLGGGTLAKDLTQVYSRYKDDGLSVALQKLAFPVMQETFANKTLTDDEVFQLKAFFYQSDKEGTQNLGFQKKFIFLGLGGVVLVLGGIDFIWRRRRKSSIRRAQGGIR
jgi:mono/diheme cytochrome c family protein